MVCGNGGFAQVPLPCHSLARFYAEAAWLENMSHKFVEPLKIVRSVAWLLFSFQVDMHKLVWLVL